MVSQKLCYDFIPLVFPNMLRLFTNTSLQNIVLHEP